MPMQIRRVERHGRLAPLISLVLLTTSIAAAIGRRPIRFELVEQWLSGRPSEECLQLLHLLREVRLPRIAAALLVGAGLSTSGATLQGMFNNPLVSPGLLGTVAGASFGAALALFWSLNLWLVQLFAFAFGLLAVILVLLLSRGRGRLSLLLGGMLSGALFQTFLAVLKLQADPYHQLPAIVHFTIGNLALADRTTLTWVAPGLSVALLAQCATARLVNILSLGDDEARSLGVPVTAGRALLVVLAALASSLCVVLAGAIGWVGLVVPHLARRWTGALHERTLPASALIGASYLVTVDAVARVAFATEVPTGVVTALLGIPFLGVLVRSTSGRAV